MPRRACSMRRGGPKAGRLRDMAPLRAPHPASPPARRRRRRRRAYPPCHPGTHRGWRARQRRRSGPWRKLRRGRCGRAGSRPRCSMPHGQRQTCMPKLSGGPRRPSGPPGGRPARHIAASSPPMLAAPPPPPGPRLQAGGEATALDLRWWGGRVGGGWREAGRWCESRRAHPPPTAVDLVAPNRRGAPPAPARFVLCTLPPRQCMKCGEKVWGGEGRPTARRATPRHATPL